MSELRGASTVVFAKLLSSLTETVWISPSSSLLDVLCVRLNTQLTSKAGKDVDAAIFTHHIAQPNLRIRHNRLGRKVR